MTEIDSHAVKEQQRKDWGQAAANWKSADNAGTPSSGGFVRARRAFRRKTKLTAQCGS